MARFFRLSLRLAVLLLLLGATIFAALDARGAVALALIEALLLVGAATLLVRMIVLSRQQRADGRRIQSTLERDLTLLLPRQVARLLALELCIWLFAALWILRNRPRGPEYFSYSRNSVVGLLLLAAFLSTPVELLLAELLIPWEWLRLIFLALALYALLWALGFVGSLSVFPHQLTERALDLCYGFLAIAIIPYEEIVSVRMERAGAPSGRDGCQFDPKRQNASFVVGGATQVVLELAHPQVVRRLLRDLPPVRMIRIAVDEPQRFVEALQQRLTFCDDDAGSAMAAS